MVKTGTFQTFAYISKEGNTSILLIRVRSTDELKDTQRKEKQ
jgi:hypothetical protein